MSDNISQDIAVSGQGNIVVGKGDVIINPLLPAEERLRHDLGILLKNVQTTWIHGVLEKSVHEAALLDLGMEMREDAVDNPWRIVIEGPEQPREIVPRGRKIKDIFYEANGLLLILGEPGSGKTTTLLQLARDLIAEVGQVFVQPVPVILNLSTWTNKQQPLDEWLVAELNSKYRLPKKQGTQWLEEHRILPLLDGLDEVKLENRAACVERINRLVADYGLQGLVVCSRIKDYTDLNVRLAFYRAIYLQPLTPEQVDQYLDRGGDKLIGLRATLESDEALRSMAQSPLILNILSLAYQNVPAEQLHDPALATDKARRQHLFDSYIARMFHRKARGSEYDHQQTKQYLSWLARNLLQHNQDVFLIESLQPSCLLTRTMLWVYFIASRIIIGLIVGLGIRPFLVGHAWSSVTIGLVTGLSVGLADVMRFEWLQKRKDIRKIPIFWWAVINVVIVCLTIGSITRLVEGSGYPSGYVLIAGPFYSLLFGLRLVRQSPEIDIQAVEALRWSWRKAFKGGLVGGGIGVIAGLIGGDLIGLLFAAGGVIINGLGREIIETKSIPNQGIRLSMRNASYGGVIFGLTLGLVFGFSDGLMPGLIGGLIVGLIGALWYGGLDVIQHYILRLLILFGRHAPANYTRFLDYAVDRIFLQKVGGGYRFIHRLLLEHFADMAEEQISL